MGLLYFTGENCEVWLFSNRTDDYPAQREMFLWSFWTCRLLTALLLSENFIKPYSEEHMLVHLLKTAL